MKYFRPTIEQVISCKEGKAYSSREHLLELASREDNILRRLRLDLATVKDGPASEYLYVCGYCYRAVRLRGGEAGEKKQLHFTHAKQNPECKYHKGEILTKEELNRRIYAFLREGADHHLLKDRLEECLLLEGNTYETVSQVEKEKNITLGENWRRPDINFRFEDNHIALELQLSTTYLDVILERHKFYKASKMFMLWIFRSLTLDAAERSFTLDDVIFRNCDNAYIFDDLQYQKSIDAKRLLLRCFYLTHHFDKAKKKISSTWNEKEISLSDLTFDREKDLLYYFNAEESLLAARKQQRECEAFYKEKAIKLNDLQYDKEQFASRINYNQTNQRYCQSLISSLRQSSKDLWVKYKGVRQQLITFLQHVPKKSSQNNTGNKKSSRNSPPQIKTILDPKTSILKSLNDQISKHIIASEINRKRLDKAKAENGHYKTEAGISLVDISNEFDTEFYHSNKQYIYRRNRLVKFVQKCSESILLNFDREINEMVKGDVFIYLPVDVYEPIIEELIARDTDEMNSKLQEIEDFEANYRQGKIDDFRKSLDGIQTSFSNHKKELRTEISRLAILKTSETEMSREAISLEKQISNLKGMEF
jgi:hypothetical protein